MKNLYVLLIAVVVSYSCSNPKKEEKKVTEVVTESEDSFKAGYQSEYQGKKIDLYKLIGKDGFEVRITNYGARIVSILTPDKEGKLDDVVLGFSDIKPLLDRKDPYFGCSIGRYANRIGNIASFKLDGKKYNLHINNNDNIMHGGFEGFHHKVWDVVNANDKKITMKYLSPDGEEGFPGNLEVSIIFSVNDLNELKIEYKATTDKATVVNFTNQTYFNLKGEGEGSIENHLLQINGEFFLPIDSENIPTGKMSSVKATSFDFLSPKAIGESIDVRNDQIDFANGYDHNWVIKKKSNAELVTHAVVKDPDTGRVLEVKSIEPGLQFYSGNKLDGTLVGKKGNPYVKRSGFCLETQHFPNSPNNPDFPSTRLDPGAEFYSYTVYKFSVEKS